MKFTLYFRLASLAALIALFAGCSGNSAAPLPARQDTGGKVSSTYDPFAPAIEVSPLEQAVAAAPRLVSGGFSVTALDNANAPDLAALAALDLNSDGGRLSIALTRELPSLALYVSYDPAAGHAQSLEAGFAGGIGYALEYEPGRLALGVSGIRGALIPAGQSVAEVRLADGPAAVVLRGASISQDPRTAVRDLEAIDNSDGSATLGWSERNTGDYDLNGEVNISDITPVGKYFNTAYGEQSDNYAQLEVVDGDDNFEINISDLTPIGLNFTSVITGYNVYRTELTSPDEEPDPAESGRWTKVENESEPSGPSIPRDFNGQDFRLRYTFVDNTGNGDFGWYVAPVGSVVDDPLEGPVSNVFTLTVGGGEAPPALLSFEIMPPDSALMNVGNEFYLAVNVADIEGLFSANVRFEYDASLVEFIEAVPAYDANVNFLTPPLFVAADDVGDALEDYVLLGFNATQTQGEAGKDGSGALGYFKFKAIGPGIKEDGFRFPQATNFIYLWGEQYGVPTATPVLGAGQLLNIGP